VLAAVAAGLFGLAPPGTAAAGVRPDTCGDSAPARLLLDSGHTTPARPSAGAGDAVAQYKADHDTEAATLREYGASTAAAHEARKLAAGTPAGKSVTVLTSEAALQACAYGAAAEAGTEYTSGPGYAWVDYLNQQGQWNSYYCGPATVSEMALTVPGPSWVDQGTAASYMGTDPSSGTTVGALVSGLNYYVGVPNYGWNFYSFVWMDYNPTPQQRSNFLANLQYDVSVNSPVAGDAWEVAGGPHLIGHPVGQTIFHWFEIGGWSTNTSQVYYADSATSVWSSVPRYSWQDTYTVASILGGRGYAW